MESENSSGFLTGKDLNAELYSCTLRRSNKSVIFSDFEDACTEEVGTRSESCIHENSNSVLHHSRSMYRRANASESSSDGEGGDFSTCSESWEETWSAVNEQKVTLITLNSFYKPQTLTLLLVIVISLVCVGAFYQGDLSDSHANVALGLYASCFLFLSIGVLMFPNGPYTRPQPAIWRLVFCMSIVYLVFLSFILFHSYSDVRLLLKWIDHSLNGSASDSMDMYSDNCSVSWKNMYRRLDIFVPGHVVGWLFKAMLVRHTVILWSISIMWELTELFFAHVLPNFSECWWDMLLFDVLFGNGLGIYVGMVLCRKLEMRTFYWQSIKDIRGTKGKLKRSVLQFSPQDRSKIRWLDPSSTWMRVLAIFILILIFQITELNGFLLKHIFYIPTNHFLTIGRLFFVLLVGAPSIRQYYLYTTDKTCKRLGMQSWIYLAIMITELLISIRFGGPMLPRPSMLAVVAWLGVVALLSIVIVFLITSTHVKRFVSMTTTKTVQKRKGVEKKIT